MLIDAFTFYNEADLLQLRLETLRDHVDQFVIVEMGLTHSGMRKPLLLADRLDKLAAPREQITYVGLYDWPRVDPRNEPERWVLENYQRNCITRGLDEIGAKSDDVLLISDLDEIPDPNALMAAIEALSIKPFVSFAQLYRKHFVNAILPSMAATPLWLGTVATRVGTLQTLSPTEVRRGDADRSALVWTGVNLRDDTAYLNPAGWHFTYFGGPVADRIKHASIVEGWNAHQSGAFAVPPESRHNYRDGRTPEVESWLHQSGCVLWPTPWGSTGGLNYLPVPLRDNPGRWERLWWFDEVRD